ncbi:sugar ABC transporter ATP-binding protein [Microbispora sp. NBRC 16548]|uniref:sugar ABC transporter ATP-binding protein n=1 Tax=Microbispora sp. NBRC 16548 TaxID=3030994 RepID=UPI0024A028DD|nr:sugar ABC transporter ATP-binding protein [Microbispora sp. NBRC 16548]GLX11315.1 sugar ABC transporter ATP-binding protein [Microbispora sp. NBRC 16548]
MTPPDDRPILVARDISKSYGGVRALRNVTFTAYEGKVNVLVGENGAGKSTLMKILAGAESPTSGTILLDGEEVSFRSPRDAMSHGIGIIHQELSLFPNLSIAENIFAGREPRGALRMVDFAAERAQAAAVLARLGLRVDPATPVGALPIGQQQLVEIGRVLAEDVRVLIMDEPTSALSNQEVDTLFEVMDDLRRDGVTVIYISHRLEEFRRIGDHVTVLRDGGLVAHAPMTETDTGWIVRQMVGRSQEGLFAHNSAEVGEALLSVTDLTAPGPAGPVLDSVSLEVRQGEVVGVYGLMGAGRTELMECLMGSRRAGAGEIRVRGRLCAEANVPARLAAGLALVPEDRQREGLVQTLSVKDNVLLSSLTALSRRWLLSPRREKSCAREQVADLRIKTPALDAEVTALSGGNQQKVVLARALLTEPTVLLLDEPTRGVDVGAKAEISRVISDLAGRGLGVLFASSELAEVMAMADRILVMAKGRITGEFEAGRVSEKELVAAAASEKALGGQA